MSGERLRPARELVVWLALLLLLGLTLGLAFVPLGSANGPISLFVAALMAATLVIFFMRLPRESALIWLASAAGLWWLVVFFMLTFSDYLTRRT